MQDSNNMVMTEDQELVDVLLDFVIVAASLAKKINQAMKIKTIKEGGTVNGQNERIGNGNQRSAQCRHRY